MQPCEAVFICCWDVIAFCFAHLSEDCSNIYLPIFQVLIADDYSDPFDAKSELNRMGKGENTGYMEPYEAQRIMAGKKRQLHL